MNADALADRIGEAVPEPLDELVPATRMERLGAAAGAGAVVLLAVVLAVDPFGVLSAADGRTVPVTVDYLRATVVGLPVGLAAGVAAGVGYFRRADRVGVQPRPIARGVCQVLSVVAGTLVVLVALGGAVGGLLDGGVGAAALGGLLGLLDGLVAAAGWLLFALTVLAAPATGGVVAGVRLAQTLPGRLPVVDAEAPATGRQRPSRTAMAAAAVVPGRTLPDGVRPTPDWFGWWAGLLASVVVGVPVFVWPSPAFAVSLTGGQTVATRPGGAGPTTVLALGVAVLVGLLAAWRYRATVEDPSKRYRWSMAVQATLSPMVVVALALVVFLAVNRFAQNLSGGFFEAVLAVVGVAYIAPLPATAAGVAAAVVVGVPTAVGVLLEQVVHGVRGAVTA
jgi:hypothetical protein